MSVDLEQAWNAYQRFFTNLTDQSVEDFRDLAAVEVRYRDPLMDSKGVDAVVESMHKWFHDNEGIKFEIGDHARVRNVVFSHWFMNFRIRKMPGRQWRLEGTSKITFDDAGRVVEQIDYWDATPMFEAVPILGRIVSLIRRLQS